MVLKVVKSFDNFFLLNLYTLRQILCFHLLEKIKKIPFIKKFYTNLPERLSFWWVSQMQTMTWPKLERKRRPMTSFSAGSWRKRSFVISLSACERFLQLCRRLLGSKARSLRQCCNEVLELPLFLSVLIFFYSLKFLCKLFFCTFKNLMHW